MISPGVFFFHFFKILIFQLVSVVKRTKTGPKWQKILSVAINSSGIIHHTIVIYFTLVENDNISRCFYHFFKFLIFRVVRGVKWQKTVQNDKKFCLSCSICQEQYIIWFSFMGHMWKMIISADVLFHFLKILILGIVRGVKGQKTFQRDKNFCL